jgi:hypothetical protein
MAQYARHGWGALLVAILWLAPTALHAGDRAGASEAPEGPALRLREELPDETRVHIDVELPPGEAPIADSACGVFVAGRARALRGEIHRFDVAIVLDSSRSTIEPAEADIDSDGEIGLATLLPVGSTFEVGCTDPGDSILAAEIAAARELLRGLDPASTRVALVSFAGEVAEERPWSALTRPFARFFAKPAALTREPLTSDYSRIEAALDALAQSEPSGGTNMAAGVDLATAELREPSGGLAEARPDSHKIVFFFTDGWPTLPHDATDEAGNVREVLLAAERARAAGVRVHSFAIGREALAGPIATLELSEITGGLFTPVRHPADLVDVVGEVSFANLEGVTLRNRTTERDAESFRLTADGTWAGFVRVAPGPNQLEIHARASDGAEATRTLAVSTAPNGREPAIPPDFVAVRNQLLEECLATVKALRMEAERARAEQVRRLLQEEIARERARARERAEEQRKRLRLDVQEEPGAPGR